jgi:hypothetical protein
MTSEQLHKVYYKVVMTTYRCIKPPDANTAAQAPPQSQTIINVPLYSIPEYFHFP